MAKVYDIFIPDLKLGIEIQGIQHFEYKKFFFKDSESFLNSIKRDMSKNTICFLNEIEIIYINYNFSENKWKSLLDNTIEKKIKLIKENTKIFFNLGKYNFNDIKNLLCPICKTILDFKFDKNLKKYNSKCCRKNFSLIESGNFYIGEISKI